MRLVPGIPPLFGDRAAGGRALAAALAALELEQRVVVGVARGGVALARASRGQVRGQTRDMSFATIP